MLPRDSAKARVDSMRATMLKVCVLIPVVLVGNAGLPYPGDQHRRFRAHQQYPRGRKSKLRRSLFDKHDSTRPFPCFPDPTAPTLAREPHILEFSRVLT